MTTLFGVPLYGPLFAPLIVGIGTFIFLWVCVFSKKGPQKAATREEPEELQKASTRVNDITCQTKEMIKDKDKKKKKCVDSGSCCSKKSGKVGGCSSQNKVIETAKIFVDSYSNHCQEFAGFLTEQLSIACLTAELLPVSELTITELNKHTDGSLCVFLIDTSVVNEQNHWLEEALSSLKNSGKPLMGMKYSVFLFQPSPIVKAKVDVIDQLLHKSGAVRVCRAKCADLSSVISSSDLDEWAKELCGQVQKWNEPKRKGCKCGSKKANKRITSGDPDEPSSSSSACSDSEDSDGINSTLNPILDLEDIGKLL